MALRFLSMIVLKHRVRKIWVHFECTHFSQRLQPPFLLYFLLNLLLRVPLSLHRKTGSRRDPVFLHIFDSGPLTLGGKRVSYPWSKTYPLACFERCLRAPGESGAVRGRWASGGRPLSADRSGAEIESPSLVSPSKNSPIPFPFV